MIVAIVLICLFLIVAKHSFQQPKKDDSLNHINRFRSTPLLRKK